MSRMSRFAAGISASYISVATTIVYSVAIVPIGLRYLGTEQFGLWMLLVQVAGYLNIIELGIFSSAARILIDHKDEKHGRQYADTIATAWIVLFIQGLLMATACTIFASTVVQALKVPSDLQNTAVHILTFLGLSSGLGTCFKIYSAVLYANQRIDLLWSFVSLNPILSLAIIWPLLAGGYGLYALPWSFFPPVIATACISWLACRRLNMMPPRLGLANISARKLRELFLLGADFFLINIGTQLLEASQLMIVSRTMGLTAAATWSVSTKLYTLLFQLIAKLENTAIVFFSEMMARGEHRRLHSSFRQMYQLTGSLAICGMFAAVVVNPFFVGAWAGPEVLWPQINNWLMALLLVINLLLRCHTDFAMHTKKVGLLRFLYFFESIVFVTAALWAAPRYGFVGILVSAIACALLFRFVYAIRRTATYFGIPAFSVAWRWIAFLIAPATLMSCVAVFSPALIKDIASPAARVLVSAGAAGTAAAAILCSVGLPADVRRSFLERIRRICSTLLALAKQATMHIARR